MSVQVDFGTCTDAPNKLNKTFTSVLTTDCILKENCDVLQPIFIVQQDLLTLKDCNYMEAFGKSYFIDSVTSVTSQIVRVSGHIDVLKTYGEYINKCYGTLKRTSDANYYDRMLHDERYPFTEDKLTACRKFPVGLNSESFILLLTGVQTADA